MVTQYEERDQGSTLYGLACGHDARTKTIPAIFIMAVAGYLFVMSGMNTSLLNLGRWLTVTKVILRSTGEMLMVTIVHQTVDGLTGLFRMLIGRRKRGVHQNISVSINTPVVSSGL
mgnify:CR=1 FL=1